MKKHLADIELSGCNLANWPLQWPALWTDHDWALYSVWQDLMVRMIARRWFSKIHKTLVVGILSPGMNLWPCKSPALKSDMNPLSMSSQNMYPLLCVCDQRWDQKRPTPSCPLVTESLPTSRFYRQLQSQSTRASVLKMVCHTTNFRENYFPLFLDRSPHSTGHPHLWKLQHNLHLKNSGWCWSFRV